MQSNLTARQPLLDQSHMRLGLVIIALVLITPSLIALLAGKHLLALVALVAPLPFLIITNLRLAFYLFLLSLCVQFSLPISRFYFHPYDMAMGLLFLAVVADFLLHGRREIRSTGFDTAWGWLIGATLLSGLLAFNPSYSIVPIFRIIAIYICFRVVFKLATEISVRRILVWFVAAMTILSGINILLFLYYGGAIRVFGLMDTPYNGFCITSLPIAFSFYIWARNKKEQFWFGLSVPIMFMGIIGTQSRAPILSVLISIPILLWLARKKILEVKGSNAGARIRQLFFWIGLIAVPAVILGGALFIPLLERLARLVDSMSEPQGTIALRVVLWTAALKGFLSNPITGIGIGNFRLIDQIIPDIKISPVFYYIRGLSAHSLVLHYLAETGLIGLAALANLAIRGIKVSSYSFRLSKNDGDNQVSAALLIASIVFAHSSLYIGFWTWTQGGYLLAIIFALIAAWSRLKKPA